MQKRPVSASELVQYEEASSVPCLIPGSDFFQSKLVTLVESG